MYSCILHATDLKENHYNICNRAAKMASYLGAALHLIHVIEPPASLQLAQGLGFAEFDSPIKENAQTVMRVLGEALNIPVEQQHVEVGAITTHILEKAKDLGCHLIIIGSHGPSHLPAFLGNTADAIIHHALCDVLTLRSEE